MAISISFSAVIYKVSINEVERFDQIQRTRYERRFGFPPPPAIDPQLIEDTEKRIITNLVIINIAIAVISGTGGYFLAGITLKPIKEMVEEQNRFISDASHEIRTPLTSLKVAMEVYLREKKPTLQESKTLIEESIVEVNKLQNLSQSLLQLNQHENPNEQEKFDKIQIKEVLENATQKISPLAKERNISIENKVENYQIFANKYALTDLFVILLDNAIKYSKENSKVEIESKKTDGHINVSVKDYGIGIEEKDVPHIFDRFYRADTARSKENSGGYGLGLSIAKKIVDKHGGSISVKSELGKGSTFILRLPVLK